MISSALRQAGRHAALPRKGVLHGEGPVETNGDPFAKQMWPSYGESTTSGRDCYVCGIANRPGARSDGYISSGTSKDCASVS